MANEMICPDCGGVVGASETTAAGPPCTCFTNTAATETTVDFPSPQEKICALCGKDVTGHRRVKDSRGYICYECAKDEQRRERGDRINCASCGRPVKESVLMEYDGTKMCPQCHAERVALAKQQLKRIGISSAYSREEKRRLYMLAIAAGVLLLIMILAHFRILQRIF
jgi:hypothetical protein